MRREISLASQTGHTISLAALEAREWNSEARLMPHKKPFTTTTPGRIRENSFQRLTGKRLGNNPGAEMKHKALTTTTKLTIKFAFDLEQKPHEGVDGYEASEKYEVLPFILLQL